MNKKIRVKKTDTFQERDKVLLSTLEVKCLNDGHMVNIADDVARKMIAKGWVINIDPLKSIQTERSLQERLTQPSASQVTNPGLEDEDGIDGTKDVPPEDSGKEAGDHGGGSKSNAGGKKVLTKA